MKELQDFVGKYPILNKPLSLEHIRVLYGANYFSGGPVIHMRVNLNEYDEIFTSEIPGFYEDLSSVLPTLIEHHCSEGVRGGFFIRVKEGTLLGHVIEHVAIELQTLAGMDVSYGKTRSSVKKGVYNIIFRYFDEYAGIYAGKAALNLVNSILTKTEFNVLDVIEQLLYIREKHHLGPGTQAIVNELEQRRIPWMRLDDYNLIQIGTGKLQKRIRATLTPSTSLIAVEISQDRLLTLTMLKDAGLPAAQFDIIHSANDIYKRISSFSGQMIYNRYRNTGQPFALPLFNQHSAEIWETRMRKKDDEYLLLPAMENWVIRLLVIGTNCAAAAKINLPFCIGNGINTIEELIQQLNSNEPRQKGDKGTLSTVEIDKETISILQMAGYDTNHVPLKDEIVLLKTIPNPNNGASCENVTKHIHPNYKLLAVRASQIIGLDVSAVTFITSDLTVSPEQCGAYITEIVAAPNFRMFINPYFGTPEPVVPLFVDYLTAGLKKMHIPLISVTGSKGKTFCTQILFHCLSQNNMHISMTNSEGLYLSGRKMKEAEIINPEFVRLILRDPQTDIAIAETPVESIFNYGLGYQFADFGIVLNIGNEHINEIDIKRADDLAYAKSVVAEEIDKNGYAVLNADEPLIAEMQQRVIGKIAWFSKNPDNNIIKQYGRNKSAVLLSSGNMFSYFDKGTKVFEKEIHLPQYFIDDSGNPYDSVLAAILTLLLMKMDIQQITEILNSMPKS